MTRESDVCPADVEGLTGRERETKDLQARCDISDNNGCEWFISLHFNAFDGVAHGAETYIVPGGTGQTMAKEIMNKLSPVMGTHGEPVKDGSHLYVVLNPEAHCVLVEFGFINGDAGLIEQHLHEFAGLIAPAILKFIGGKIPENAPVEVINVTPKTEEVTPMENDPDVYLTVRVRTSKADNLKEEIIKMGYATKRLELA
jgi:N-acetylmuramoyl-L-alanine amidase